LRRENKNYTKKFNLLLSENHLQSFIIPTDAHNYKITGMLKTIKIPTIAPTCFGPSRNHHQGAILCLAKTTLAQQADMPP